jgi:hypothetical protein
MSRDIVHRYLETSLAGSGVSIANLTAVDHHLSCVPGDGVRRILQCRARHGLEPNGEQAIEMTVQPRSSAEYYG